MHIFVIFSCCIQMCDIADGYLSLMSDGGDIREDLRVPEGEIGQKLRQEFESGNDHSG